MKHAFSILLTMCVLMIVGAALITRLDVSDQPRPRQGRTLTVTFGWNGASAKVLEQEVTSRVEGVVGMVNGVASVSSESNFGHGRVEIRLKPEASVSSVKFEVASLLRQLRDKLPPGVSYPQLAGGEVVTRSSGDYDQPILTYHINADMPDREIRKLVERQVKPYLMRVDGVRTVDVSGGSDLEMEVAYDADLLSNYGITAGDLADAIRSYLGRENVVGDAYRHDSEGNLSRITLFLKVDGDKIDFESIPVVTVGEKIIYLNNLATCSFKEKVPHFFYRVNGMNTVYLTVYAEENVNINKVAAQVKTIIDDSGEVNGRSLYFTCDTDRAKERFSEFQVLIRRSAISLVILLLFVFLCKRDWKYLFIVAVSLLANLLLAVICYDLFDMRLEPFSMAGVTISLGLIIDSTIVMVDHYSYHHDHRAFTGIMAAMLTTIGSLIIVFWLPDSMKDSLYDFAWMIIVNLAVALLVSALFVPALVTRMNYSCRKAGSPRNLRIILLWNRFYRGYMRVAQHRILRWPIMLAFFGLFGWTLCLFLDTVNKSHYEREKREVKLYISGKMPVGGTAAQLNEKVLDVEAFLSTFKEIKHFESYVSDGGAQMMVEFTDEAQNTSFPYKLENKTIGKLVSIGGADWATHGVSERGFSNSLNLQYRSQQIVIAGYDYDQLYRYAEIMQKKMKENPRVVDLVIRNVGEGEQEQELYMEYDREKLTAYGMNVNEMYGRMASILSEYYVGRKGNTDIVLRPHQYNSFDQWQMENSFLKLQDREVRLSDFMNISQREAKKSIKRENQEYVITLAFNVLGSYNYTYNIVRRYMEEFDAMMPVGFRCLQNEYRFDEEENQQYLLLGLVAIIIFFICSIVFESLYKALVIILLIPISMVGAFLVYHFGGVEFGLGGFAALVLLSGLTVNAGIYLMNEYNNNGKNYLRAYNHKIIPILLTVLSTVLGLVPFVFDQDENHFWYSFAMGSIGGLLFSLLALVFAMPVFTPSRRSQKKGKG
ncbi:efflux RND transporter permease subunit [Xylanibacter brevis]|uniref:efflux RND transporter permease subunit n=1 Tax=Xylanibacter brevis TaxID=83231 RepID=UPI00048833F6|nr:efflux RND transporter permease subunit [Xylanibacter brevis]